MFGQRMHGQTMALSVLHSATDTDTVLSTDVQTNSVFTVPCSVIVIVTFWLTDARKDNDS